jgi:hypothetical protein
MHATKMAGAGAAIASARSSGRVYYKNEHIKIRKIRKIEMCCHRVATTACQLGRQRG